jgi:hypothetical protein
MFAPKVDRCETTNPHRKVTQMWGGVLRISLFLHERLNNMNYPILWSPLAITLVIFGGCVAIFSTLGLFRPGKDDMEVRDRHGHVVDSYSNRRRRHIKVVPGIIAVLLIAAGFGTGMLGGLLQGYQNLTSKILVAHVHATQLQNAGSTPQMSVDITLYDQDGKKTSSNIYLIKGKELTVSGDIIQLKSWVNLLGIHSGYKVTLLEGRYTDSNRKTQVDDITLNGGDDPIFEQAYNSGGESFFVTSAYKNGSTIPANGISYNICASNDAIVPQPDNQPC